MTKFELELPGKGMMTSLVMTKDEFKELCLHVRETGLVNDEIMAKVEQAGHLPLVERYEDTKRLFDIYGVKHNYLSAIVQGKGKEILENASRGQVHMDSETAQALTDKVWEKTSEEDRTKIDEASKDISGRILQGGDPTNLVSSFIGHYGASLPRKARILLLEQTLESLAQNVYNTRQQLGPEQWEEYFPQYVKRLLLGIYEAMTKGATN